MKIGQPGRAPATDAIGDMMTQGTVALSSQGCKPEVTTDVAPILEKKAFLFDFDGTVWMGGTMIPGVAETIKELRQAGKQPIYLTNNSSKSRAEYFERLQKLGLCADPNEIVMSTDTVTTYLKQHGFSSAYIMGTPAMREMCAEAGVAHEENPAKVAVAVIGFDRTSTAEKLTTVARLVAKGVPYIVAHPDPFCPSDEGPIVDCGAYYACIKTTTGVEAKAVLGKPSASMIAEVEKRFSFDRSDMVVLGDRLYTDVALGREAGVDSVLVLSGENTLEHAALSDEKPTWILNSVADLRSKIAK
jgi:NagD protein